MNGKLTKAQIQRFIDIHFIDFFCSGGVLPQGVPFGRNTKLICQRFSKDSKLGKTLGYKDDHFATLYDTLLRIPIMSMATVHVLADEKWPNVPYMLEQGSVLLMLHLLFHNSIYDHIVYNRSFVYCRRHGPNHLLNYRYREPTYLVL